MIIFYLKPKNVIILKTFIRRFFMELQDLKDSYKSKTAEERYDYYRTLPLDEKDLFSNTLLDIALNFADVEALKILLERNVDVNEINSHGNRPLHNLILLSEYKNLNDVLTCVELLLDNGASVLKKKCHGRNSCFKCY